MFQVLYNNGNNIANGTNRLVSHVHDTLFFDIAVFKDCLFIRFDAAIYELTEKQKPWSAVCQPVVDFDKNRDKKIQNFSSKR